MAEETADKLKTLIVDDEPLAVERMQVICSKIPELQVVGTASDGAQALRLVEALQPDLMLLDMTMPEIDGISVAKSLSKKSERPAVVFVTAHDNQDRTRKPKGRDGRGGEGGGDSNDPSNRARSDDGSFAEFIRTEFIETIRCFHGKCLTMKKQKS